MKKSNNKGFSLVELIIVIAIMAVLVGLLAPQYLKYVHNSKVSTDISNAQDVATALNVLFADCEGDQTKFGTAAGSATAPSQTPDGKPLPALKATGGSMTVNMDWNNMTGVSTITDGTNELYPDPKKAGTGYYTVNHK